MKRFCCLGAVLSLLVLAAGVVKATEDPGRNRPSTGPGSPPKLEGPTALTRAAQDAGLQVCRPVADQVTRFLIGNGQSSGMLMASPDNANARIASASIEIETPRGLSYASASYAPYGAVGCGVVYDALTYWSESCASVAAKLSKDLKPMGTLGKQLVMLDGGPTMRMFLMPAGPGCVQIKKEIVY